MEATTQRHRRAVGLVCLAVVAMALAGAAYLRPSVTAQTGVAASTTGFQLSNAGSDPAPPRSAGLLIDGAISVLIEEYGGLDASPPLALIDTVRIENQQSIAIVVQELNSLPAYPSAMWCAFGDGSFFVMDFAYARGSTFEVRVEANGCQGVYFGRWDKPVAWAVNATGLYDTLTDLLAHQYGRPRSPH